MADPPTHRGPAACQQHGSVSECGMDADPVPRRNQARILASQPSSEVADGNVSEAAYLSMTEEELDEDDLLDYDEEYQKEIEEQRLADEKNGHFREDQQPPIRSMATAEEAAEYLALSLAAFPLCQDVDTMMLDKESSSFAKDGDDRQPPIMKSVTIKEASMCITKPVAEAALVQKQHHINHGEGGCLPTQHGAACADSSVMEESCLENCTATNFCMPTIMGSQQKISPMADSTIHLS